MPAEILHPPGVIKHAVGARQRPELQPAADDEALVLVVAGDRDAMPGSADGSRKPGEGRHVPAPAGAGDQNSHLAAPAAEWTAGSGVLSHGRPRSRRRSRARTAIAWLAALMHS